MLIALEIFCTLMSTFVIPQEGTGIGSDSFSDFFQSIRNRNVHYVGP